MLNTLNTTPIDITKFISDNPSLLGNTPPTPQAVVNATQSIQPQYTSQLDYQKAIDAGYMPSEIQSAAGTNSGMKLINGPDSIDDLNSTTNWGAFTAQAQKLAKLNDFPVSVLLGQAELESGKGESGLTTGYNNYFGIKGMGSNGAVVMPTQEYDPNQGYYSTNSQFAAYKSSADSIQAYINLIKNGYGMNVTAKSDPMQVLQQIQSHGYATDPTYADQVANTDSFKNN